MLKSIYHFFMRNISPRMRINIEYLRIFKSFPNLEKPNSINEKILRRILCEKDHKFSFFADKYAVRSYIEQVLGQECLVPLLYHSSDAEDLKKLKNWTNIVIKPNHGAGMVKVIDKEPSDAEKIQIIQKAKDWLKIDFGKVSDETHYSEISPKILVEQKITALGEDLKDYKFHRFLQKDGSYRQILQIVAERSLHGFETAFFDIDNLDEIIHSPFGYNAQLSLNEKNSIHKIVELNKKLCPDYGYVRLDWYITVDKIYFGEITFTSGAGRSKSFDGNFGIEMGNLWVIK